MQQAHDSVDDFGGVLIWENDMCTQSDVQNGLVSVQELLATSIQRGISWAQKRSNRRAGRGQIPWNLQTKEGIDQD